MTFMTVCIKKAFIHLCQMDCSTSSPWTDPFPIEGTSGKFLLLPCFTEKKKLYLMQTV